MDAWVIVAFDEWPHGWQHSYNRLSMLVVLETLICNCRDRVFGSLTWKINEALFLGTWHCFKTGHSNPTVWGLRTGDVCPMLSPWGDEHIACEEGGCSLCDLWSWLLEGEHISLCTTILKYDVATGLPSGGSNWAELKLYLPVTG